MSAPTPPSTASHDTLFLHQLRTDFDADVAKASSSASKQDLLSSIHSFHKFLLNEISRRPPTESEFINQGFSLLWYQFIEVAGILDKDDGLQDKLVLLLLQTKEVDALRELLHPDEAKKPEWGAYGFTEHLQSAWKQLVLTGTKAQQYNLASFCTKALAAGMAREEIGLVALWFLREALETDDEEATGKLLPAAVVWMEERNYTLLTLSVIGKPYTDDAYAAPGVLARAAGITEPGLSMQRWLFWRRRLQELSRSGDEEVVREVKKGFIGMIFCGRDMGVDVPGEKLFQERLQKAMGEELKRSGKESVEWEDVDVDLDWVD